MAVKRLKCNSSTMGERELEREAECMQGLQHPHLVEILGVCVSPDFHIVMEFLQRGSLHRWLKENEESVTLDLLLKAACEVVITLN